jgi:predicted DNA-binding transcriptional regulator AlpA
MAAPDRSSGWTGADVRAFMQEHKFASAGELSKAIGISRNRAYELCKDSAPIPRTVALAMIGWAAHAMGLPVWKRPGKR